MECKADVLRKAEGRAWPGRTCKRDEFAELDADGLLRGAGCGMHGLSGSHAGALLLPAEPDEPGLRGGARARLAEGAGTADRGAVMRRGRKLYAALPERFGCMPRGDTEESGRLLARLQKLFAEESSLSDALCA